jgi:hypothetical protein
MLNTKPLLLLCALFFSVCTFAGTADLFDKSDKKIASISGGVLKDSEDKVLYTIVGDRIYSGADTTGNLLYTVGAGDVLGKENILVHDKAGKVAMTIWYGQFSYGNYAGHQNFTYIMGYFTAAKEGVFKIKEKLIGPALGEAKTTNLTGAEYVALFCVYMEKFDLDEHAKKRIEEEKAANAAAAQESSSEEGSSSESTGKSVIYFTVENDCKHDIEWCIIDVTTDYKKMGPDGTQSFSAFEGAKVCIKNGSGYTTMTVVSKATSGQTIYLCQ